MLAVGSWANGRARLEDSLAARSGDFPVRLRTVGGTRGGLLWRHDSAQLSGRDLVSEDRFRLGRPCALFPHDLSVCLLPPPGGGGVVSALFLGRDQWILRRVGAGAAGSVVLLPLLSTGRCVPAVHNSVFLASTIRAMHAGADPEARRPRALLRAVAEVLVAQERRGRADEVAVHDAASRLVEAPRPEELVQDLLGFPSPSCWITEFPGRSMEGVPAPGHLTSDRCGYWCCTARAEVFGDLVNDATGNSSACSCLRRTARSLPWPWQAWRYRGRVPALVPVLPGPWTPIQRLRRARPCPRPHDPPPPEAGHAVAWPGRGGPSDP